MRSGLFLLRENTFRRYWLGQTISGFGDQISGFALPVLAVLMLDARAWQMGLLTALVWIPHLLFGIHAGMWADRRRRRRRVMIAADLARMVVVGSVPLAFACGMLTLIQLLVVAFATGCAAVVFEVCNARLFTAVVTPERYLDAHALIHGSRAVALVSGPSVGGALVQLLSAPVALVADAISFAASAGALARMRVADQPADTPARGGLGEGLRFIAAAPVMRAALAATATVNLCTFMLAPLVPLYVLSVLGVAAGLLGLIQGLGAIGALLGALCAGTIARRLGVGATFATGCVLFTAPLALIPLAHGRGPIVVALLATAEFGSGLGVMWLDVTVSSISTAFTPERLRSRVVGAYQAVNFGVRPLGSLAGGVLGSVLGLRATLWLAVLGASAAVLWLAPSPLPRLRTLPTPHETPGESAPIDDAVR
ncbi:MFS transporter [Nocardia pseudobrasiliensis]|uniref:Putative MFS family arabinose efflux permease n=1 Tax=Nocardia pseudobrasiliensis TaxID=45979 RepID=A0A370HYC0_9NOCA|nr:MFS transporter [Nocardia pseudobrasiliensis]RDI63506.1 putative MFS family arabinose efflux permease [Nocardia pseudobrasiliensis]